MGGGHPAAPGFASRDGFAGDLGSLLRGESGGSSEATAAGTSPTDGPQVLAYGVGRLLGTIIAGHQIYIRHPIISWAGKVTVREKKELTSCPGQDYSAGMESTPHHTTPRSARTSALKTTAASSALFLSPLRARNGSTTPCSPNPGSGSGTPCASTTTMPDRSRKRPSKTGSGFSSHDRQRRSCQNQEPAVVRRALPRRAAGRHRLAAL